MQGEEVDPDDDQFGKDQSDLFDRHSSDSVLFGEMSTGRVCSSGANLKRMWEQIVEVLVSECRALDVLVSTNVWTRCTQFCS